MAPAADRPENYNSFRSWLAVLGASLAAFGTVGFLNAFGVFQESFRSFLDGSSDSDISWIGSTAMALMSMLSPVVGIIVDKYGPTIPLCLGSVAELIAIFMASLGRKYYQIFLSQGVLLGISMAFIICPSLAVVSRRVPHLRGAAFGLTIGGSSVGGIIWPIMLQQLLYHRGIGFGWTMRASGFVMMFPLAFACLTVRNAPPPTPATPETDQNAAEKSSDNTSHGTDETITKKADLSILKKRSFRLLCLGLALTYLGLLTPIFYISAYAIEQGASPDAAFYILSGLNAASFFGRVLPGLLADKYGHFNLISLATILSAIVGFCWTKATTLAGLVVFSLAYGFTSGGVMSLQAACGGKLAHHGNQGVAVGCVMGSIAITALVGTPISGQILGHSGYLALSMWTGATFAAGAVALVLARLKANKKFLAAM